MKKFHQDLVFCRSPDDNELTVGVYRKLFPLDCVCNDVHMNS